ncbi:MAG: hypothetical protein WCS87_02210 [Methylococcaceae bacterium]
MAIELRCVSNILSAFCKLDNSGVIACFALYRQAQVGIRPPHTHQLKDINSPRRHEVHEEKPKKNLRVFVVKCLKLMSIRPEQDYPGGVRGGVSGAFVPFYIKYKSCA